MMKILYKLEQKSGILGTRGDLPIMMAPFLSAMYNVNSPLAAANNVL